MKFIRHLSIRNKLLLVAFIPLATLLYFLSNDVMDKISRQQNIRRVYNDVLEIILTQEEIGRFLLDYMNN